MKRIPLLLMFLSIISLPIGATDAGQYPGYHAVHAIQYDGSGVINKVIYNDPQNGTSNNWMAVYAIDCMFVR